MAGLVNRIKVRLGPLAHVVSARHRRWRRLLASLTLDPDALPRPVEPPQASDFIICGCSRTGTSLLSAALFQPPEIITVMEPWDGMRLPPAALFRKLREDIGATGMVCYGRLDIGALYREGAVKWCRDGEKPHAVSVGGPFAVGVKWPAFWRYLEQLPQTKFLVCVRDPLEVIASFEGAGGRLAQGLNYDIAFNQRMNRELTAATTDLFERRVLLYDYVNLRLLPFLTKPNVLVVRYERWFEDQESLIADIARFLDVSLSYDRVAIRRPQKKIRLTKQQIERIRQSCRSATPLGYNFNQ